MNILGIESSCDETAVAVVKDGIEVLSNKTATSADIHAETGGVIPEDAARQQVLSIIPTLEASLKKSELKKEEIDAIAVTAGPGLIGSLLVGVETAKTLSYLWRKEIIPVNHLIGHIYANWIAPANQDELPEFPALALVVSGGHTDLVYMKNHPSANTEQDENIRWIGGTRDDAAGEAFDKTARLLGLPYPGGPVLSKEADGYREKNPDDKLDMLPRPMLDQNNYEWSFSGLKTAVVNELKGNTNYNTSRIAAQVQEAIADVLVQKTIKAIQQLNPESFLLAGGVSANRRLREMFEYEFSTNNLDAKLFYPELKYCTDNAAYIASAAYFNQKKRAWYEIDANPELSITDEA